MKDDHRWAREAVAEAHGKLEATPALNEALEILTRMVDQENVYEAQDELGVPTLCFSFPDAEPDNSRMLAIQDLIVAAGWRRAAPDMGIARPVKFERRLPPK